MPDLKTYDTFISHAWTYHDDYDRIVKLLNAAPNFRWRNYSVPRHDPLDTGNDRALTDALGRQIRPVNVVLILAGMYAAHRYWIQKEMDLARAMRKPMVGIRLWGQERVPTAVDGAVDEMVGWSTSSIVDAIRRLAL